MALLTFGLYSFDSVTHQLLRQGQTVALEPQPARALALLLSRPGEIISRDELRRAIWDAETHVDFDRGIAYVLSQIRFALQDSASNPRFLQTVPRQGYKFICPVEIPEKKRLLTTRRLTVAAAALGGAAILSYPLLPSRPIRLAVCIFDNETGRADLDSFVHSLTDVVVVGFSRLAPGRLEVIGNAASLRRPRNIRNLRSLAQELSVDYIILGQLQNQGAGLRFITHLIRLPGETHLRANRLSGSAENLGVLELAILGEYLRAVREHVLKLPLK